MKEKDWSMRTSQRIETNQIPSHKQDLLSLREWILIRLTYKKIKLEAILEQSCRQQTLQGRNQREVTKRPFQETGEIVAKRKRDLTKPKLGEVCEQKHPKKPLRTC